MQQEERCWIDQTTAEVKQEIAQSGIMIFVLNDRDRDRRHNTHDIRRGAETSYERGGEEEMNKAGRDGGMEEGRKGIDD